MIPLYTPEEFAASKAKELLPIRCTFCQIIFYKSRHDILSMRCPSNLARRKGRGDGSFCSCSCAARFKHQGRQPLEVTCKNCGVLFSKTLKEIERSPNHFCCHSCAAKWNNAHKTKGTRRSKLEVWLETQLMILYPDLEFHFNRKDAIESELDIYIPSLKLAFELNGIFHYEPIYGAEKLDKTHANDHRKILACADLEIELCLLDVSKMVYFKEKWAIPFLQIIQKIIETKRIRSNSKSRGDEN